MKETEDLGGFTAIMTIVRGITTESLSTTTAPGIIVMTVATTTAPGSPIAIMVMMTARGITVITTILGMVMVIAERGRNGVQGMMPESPSLEEGQKAIVEVLKQNSRRCQRRIHQQGPNLFHHRGPSLLHHQHLNRLSINKEINLMMGDHSIQDGGSLARKVSKASQTRLKSLDQGSKPGEDPSSRLLLTPTEFTTYV